MYIFFINVTYFIRKLFKPQPILAAIYLKLFFFSFFLVQFLKLLSKLKHIIS